LETQLEKAKSLVQRGEPDEAMDIIDEVLKKNPSDVHALIMATSILDKARRLPVAYQFAERAVRLAPQISATWTNFGRVSEGLYQLEDAERAFKMAVQLSKKPEALSLNMNNLAAFYVTTGQWETAKKIAKDCLAVDPDSRKAKGNLGLAQLATHEWKEGWVNYGHILGSDHRKIIKYRAKDEPEWDGTPGKTVVIYGEQGLGDELSFASMLPDAIRVCKKVIVDCDERLVGIFRRSFPKAKFYGTRWKREAAWDAEDMNPDYSISIGQLGALFRNKDEDFDGEPYLVPDRERHLMWREYFKLKPSPVIGIAWSGGLDWTGKQFRQWTLDQLQPIFDSVNAHWVCLQYKDAEDEIKAFGGAEIHQYKFATLTKDYDDTAALVSACDLVIGMQTSVCHLSAAMGIETWGFINSTTPNWREGQGDTVPWYSAMKLYRQSPNGYWPIEDAARVLKLRYGSTQLAVA
jgi:hypothetical protein